MYLLKTKGPERIRIVYDGGQEGTGIPFLLSEVPEVKLERGDLGNVDYELDGRLWVKRIRSEDLFGVVFDGGLFLAASRISWERKEGLVIVEGNGGESWSRPDADGDTVRAALAKLVCVYRFPFLFSISALETARILLYAARPSFGGGRVMEEEAPYGALRTPLQKVG